MQYNHIKSVRLPNRLDLILNHPPVNILTGEVIKELVMSLKEAELDRTIHVVVIRAEGKAWSAGADVAEHLPDKFNDMLDVFGELCELIRTFSITTIAAVDGLCLGGGCEVAALCDFIIATERAKFGQPEIKVGVIPPAACAHFARKFGLSNALEIILTGDVFDAATCYRMGLVTRLTSVEKFSEEVDQFAARFTGASSAVLRLARKAVFKGFRRVPKEAAKVVDEIYRVELMNTHDAVEGLQAFVEKRKAVWTNE